MALTTKTTEKLSVDIKHVLNHKLNWQIEEINLIGSGVINAVFLIHEKNLGRLAVRTPWRSEENMMDKNSSGIISLKKEAVISEHCHKYHIPVPKIHQLYFSKEINFIVSDFVAGDGQDIPPYDIGELISKIHKIPLHGLSIADQNEQSLSKIVSQRITERVDSLNKLINSNFIIPSLQELEEILNTAQTKNSLLHLDVRQPNLIGENGMIKAIIDWDNSFIGNPIMELMRIFETKELDEEDFIKGYKDVDIIQNTNAIIQCIYRLDTALMLSILFTSFINDSEKRNYYLKRVRNLTKEITNHL